MSPIIVQQQTREFLPLVWTYQRWMAIFEHFVQGECQDGCTQPGPSPGCNAASAAHCHHPMGQPDVLKPLGIHRNCPKASKAALIQKPRGICSNKKPPGWVVYWHFRFCLLQTSMMRVRCKNSVLFLQHSLWTDGSISPQDTPHHDTAPTSALFCIHSVRFLGIKLGHVFIRFHVFVIGYITYRKI